MSNITRSKCTHYKCVSLKTNVISDCNCTNCSCLFCMVKNNVISIDDAIRIEDNHKRNNYITEQKRMPTLTIARLRERIMASFDLLAQKI